MTVINWTYLQYIQFSFVANTFQRKNDVQKLVPGTPLKLLVSWSKMGVQHIQPLPCNCWFDQTLLIDIDNLNELVIHII